MANYRQALVAVDLTGSPDQVLKRAAELLTTQGIRGVVLTVLTDPLEMLAGAIDAGYVAMTMNDIDLEAMLEQARSRLAATCAESGLNAAEIVAVFGRAGDAIIDHSVLIDADIIVIGSHGRHGFSLLLGSTANAVLHHAVCDVLAVRIHD